MHFSWQRYLSLLVLGGFALLVDHAVATEDVPAVWHTKPPPVSETATSNVAPEAASIFRAEATIVNAFRKADVVAQIQGVITRINFKEGEFIEEGQVVVQFDDRRYRYEVDRLTYKEKGLELALALAKESLGIQEELYSSEAAALQGVLKQRSEVANLEATLGEAKADLNLAKLNFENCTIRAPFSGYLATLYKQPFEGCPSFEKVFHLVDSKKVYTVANVSVGNVQRFKVGEQALFISATGGRFYGLVERIGKVVDPKSHTKKIYVLIANEDGRLEVGISGSLQVVN